MATRKWNLVIAMCILFRYGVSGQLRMTPENEAAVVGTKVVLQCQGSNDNPALGISWIEYISGSTMRTISANDRIIEGAPNYALYSISGDFAVAKYHLNIDLAFISGGRYACYDGLGPFEASAHITVLKSDPVCNDTIQADGVVEEGETITYTCEVAYNSTSIDWPPVMTWAVSDETITDVIKLSMSEVRVTSVEVTGAPGLNGAIYSVRTHFEAYGGSLDPDHATNAPTYSHTHIFNVLQVYYPPRNIAIDDKKESYWPGEKITCRAVGNPTVSYRWYNRTAERVFITGAELTVTTEMDGHEFGCEAFNEIRGAERTLSKDITLVVSQITTTSSIVSTTEIPCVVPTSSCSCSAPSPGVVAGIVIAVIFFLGTLVVSVLILWQIRMGPCKKCKQGSKPQQPIHFNSSHGVYETPDTSGMTQQPPEYAQLQLT